ncbi:uncharacterized protein BKCO1_27000102 [Diplodia corticola]|uniref:Uncharacterized protein n=1 Tax=Diplodia corticola TaxID=236234 RepID=A0A1J9S2J1_9PEZI|nr:uncharacterized protein BKCO1_27000102 [Diplodia corticola]OJD33861.1 hypothetical protein BKCO1_27000102 [Diplodia corticola]
MTSTKPGRGGPSPLYRHLHTLATSHALPHSVDHLLSLRHPSATHAWGHAHLVRTNPLLGDVMDNAAFAGHLASTGRYVASAAPGATVHEVVVDEWRRRAVVRMSYHLCAKRGAEGGEGGAEVVENEVVWTLAFSSEEEVGEVRIVESVEFVDASASARLGTLVREANGGSVGEDVRGGITLRE